MQRKCRYDPLSAHPLVLALCQIRLSPIPQMDQYIPPQSTRPSADAATPSSEPERSTKSPSAPTPPPRPS